MDVFKIEQIGGSVPSPDKITPPEVTFDAGSEFNLSFFDTPEDSNTQGFSDPGSVGSTSAAESPPPQKLIALSLPPLAATGASQGMLSPPAAAGPPTVTIKQGSYSFRKFMLFFDDKFNYNKKKLKL